MIESKIKHYYHSNVESVLSITYSIPAIHVLLYYVNKVPITLDMSRMRNRSVDNFDMTKKDQETNYTKINIWKQAEVKFLGS